MENIDTTYWLSAAHIVLVVIAFALTARPFVSTYHWVLLSSFFAFGMRPALAASVGGYTNYDSGMGFYAYNYGLLYQLLFMICFSATYIPMYRFKKPRMHPLERVPGLRAFYVLFALGILALGVLHVVSRGGWLPGVRTGTINTAVPGGKYIFPFAVMSFSILIPVGVIGYIKGVGIKRWVLIPAIAIALVALSLLYMRGMVVLSVLIVLWAVEKGGKLKPKHLIIGLLAMFLIGQMLRPLGKYVVVMYRASEGDTISAVGTAAVAKLSLVDKVRALFLYTTNMDLADSWPVVIDCVEQKGFLNGTSFLTIPARFASTKYRVDSGYVTASDRVNNFFYGADYAENSFGLNVTLANEVFMNFGPLGLVLGLLPGIATWAADHWLRGTRAVSAFGMFVVLICFRGFAGELAATVQWAAGALMLAFVVQVLVRLRYGTRGRISNGVCGPVPISG